MSGMRAEAAPVMRPAVPRPRRGALPARRGRGVVRVAHRLPVPRCRRGVDEHAGPGGHHGGFHRLPGRRPAWCLVAALGIFLPTYLVVILAAPWFRRVRENRSLRSAVDGVTAAAAGAIAGAVVILGRRALIDGPTWGI